MRLPSGVDSLSESSYPRFDPHITLAALPASSEIPLSVLRASIPKSQSSLAINFKSLDIGSVYFRSVYLSVKPTAALSALHEHVHKALGLEPRTPSYPHVSLCYINDEDAEKGERAKFVELLESAGRVHRDESGDGVSLDCGEPGKKDWLAGFQAPEVWIVDCNGPVEGWKIMEKIPLV